MVAQREGLKPFLVYMEEGLDRRRDNYPRVQYKKVWARNASHAWDVALTFAHFDPVAGHAKEMKK